MKKSQAAFRLVSVFFAALLSVSAFAQGERSVKMTLVDSSDGQPVGFATVSAVPEGSKVTRYVLSTSEGTAEIKGLKNGAYKLKVELMGYKTFEKSFRIEKGGTADLGTLKIEPDVQVLEAAGVTAIGNPVIMKKDTIEYSAASFKTTDNDMLEELLKKLPGVEVDSEGNITVNGETVKKITIDGKTFFLDDPQLATKNIPAKIVEKLKVVDKKSDQAEFTGIDDGERETVIDLSIKPGMMNGWFGNVSAGGGHDIPEKNYYKPKDQWIEDGWRYQGGAMVGRFTKDSQISVILNANNSNNRGFNDISGGMMQGMRSGSMGHGSGGWGTNGITSSWMGGLNGNFSLLDRKMDLGANYLYNGSNKYVTESSDMTTYRDDGSSLISREEGSNITNSQGHRFGVRLEHKFSESTSILFEPQFNFGTGDFMESSIFNTRTRQDDADATDTNEGFNFNSGNNRNWNTSGFLLFRQRLGKPGRTISVNFRYSFSNNEMDGYNQSLTKYFEDETKEDATVNQRYESTSNSSSLSARAVYTEPLGKDFFLEANYSFSWNKSASIKNTFDSGDGYAQNGNRFDYNADSEIMSESYSNDIMNRYINQSAGLNFAYQKEKLRAQLGASIRPTDTHNMTNGESYDNSVINWSPEAMLMYDLNDNTMFRMFYWGRSSQPSTSQLMPVPDNSNPLRISFGNPYLTPYFTHNLRGMYSYTNKKTFTSVHTRLGGGIVQDGITNARWYDESGAQYSMPLNGPGSGNADIRLMVNSPIAKSKFSIYSSTYFRYNQSSTYVGKSGMEDRLLGYYDPNTGSMDYEKFNKDFFVHDAEGSAGLELLDYFTESKTNSLTFSQRLRFTFRCDLVELTLGGRTRMSKSWYTVDSGNQNPTWNNQVDMSMNWTIPGGLSLVADMDYNWYNGYTTQQDDEFIVNAELSKLLFKDKFTLALKAYDIFNQAKRVNVSDDSNTHKEIRNNTLGRYIILSLTYRFGNFGGRGGRGPMGGPPPHRR